MASPGGDAPSREGLASDPAADLLNVSSDPLSLTSPPAVSSKVSRTEETPRAEKARLDREATVLRFALVLVAAIFFLSVYTGLFNPNASESDKKWSFAVIGGMAGPFIAYVVKTIS